MQPLTKEQSQELLSFHHSMQAGTMKYLDPSQDADRYMIGTMLQSAGRTKDNYPYLYSAMESAESFYQGDDVDGVRMIGSGKTKAGKAASIVWSHSTTKTLIKGGVLALFDTATGNLVGYGESTEARKGFVTCSIDPATASDAGKNLSILYLGHSTDSDGSVRFYAYADQSVVMDDMPGVTVTNPILRAKPQNTYIEIAVGRTASQSPDPTPTDYVYVEPITWLASPFSIVPFTGNAILTEAIDFSSLAITNFDTGVYLIFLDGSSQLVKRSPDTPDSKFMAGFSVGVTPNVLQWNFPYDQLGHAATNSLVYNMWSLGNGYNYSCFYCQFLNIPFQSGDAGPTFAVCSDNTPNEGPMNCSKVRNIHYWCCCLANGTLITMEDGKKEPIETLNDFSRVITTGNMKNLAVWATLAGEQKQIADPTEKSIYRLTTENGKTITATESHMIFMEFDKCRKIADLVVGDPVMTEDGPSIVKSNETSFYHEGMFYGLALGSTKEQEHKDFPKNKASYFAGGILCGDHTCATTHIVATNHDLDYMLPRISPGMHTDYTTTVNKKHS